ncbi:2-polyprenyl-3-methyl-5-hydroxy-6-metoxy-1,4-benzoquinol methylase [Nitrosomonas sp. Nm51]|uniref:class I SAM-dependent methyltransferase n=1 Tax=Nitrosomonas sp. Nm51 TaxID=133720 RepID=UPI0008C828F4|nr:class I SAM-dependent methyltransferase [Nitrosomonas sp. Nm51]SEQ96403.1 2-polyprenyl-3-methyl-5-hydroxy-6-metoxy-1,4-benzoquinol methylase [Nitrosomonas sp. Nm51]
MNKPRSFEKLWRKRFENFAAHAEDDAGIAGWSPTGLDARLRKFKEIWHNSNHVLDKKKWLDAGCGAGTYSRFIVQQGKEVVGLDYSLPSLQKARLKGESSIVWCVADINKIPFKPGYFDGAICFGVIQALNNSIHAVSSLSRTIKPGGYICMDALNSRCLPHIWEQFSRRAQNKPIHLRYETADNLRRLMKKNGLVNIQIHWLPILPARWYRYQWIMESRLTRWLFHYFPFLGQLFCHSFMMSGQRQQDMHNV